MDESIRETWVVAGRTIQSFAKIGQSSLQEMPVKITRTVVDVTEKSKFLFLTSFISVII